MQTHSKSGGSLPWFADGCPLAVPSHDGAGSIGCTGECTLVSSSSYKGTDPIMTSCKPIYLPKASFLNTFTLGIKTSIYEFWVDIDIQSIAYSERRLEEVDTISLAI